MSNGCRLPPLRSMNDDQSKARLGKKQERLDFLADNPFYPFYTKRFAYYVGQRCRAAPIKDVAKDLALGGKGRGQGL